MSLFCFFTSRIRSVICPRRTTLYVSVLLRMNKKFIEDAHIFCVTTAGGKCSQLAELSGENINITYKPDGTHVAVGNRVHLNKFFFSLKIIVSLKIIISVQKYKTSVFVFWSRGSSI